MPSAAEHRFERILLAGSTFPELLVARLHQCVAKISLASSVDAATGLCREGEAYDAIFADAETPLPSVIELIDAAGASGTVVIGLLDRADGERRSRLEATRIFDLLLLPSSSDAIEHMLSALHRYLLLLSEVQHHRTMLARPEEIIGRSEAMCQIITSLSERAKSQAALILTGEDGTGKNLIGRSLHRLSRSGSGAFIAVDCGEVPESVLEAQVFGRPSGTSIRLRAQRVPYLPLTSGGTLLLDNIDAMSASLQQRLVRYLLAAAEGKGQKARILCTSRRRLAECAAASALIPELCASLKEIHLPPLREREGDALLIAEFLLRTTAQGLKKEIALSAGAREAILRYSWPGNVAELRCCIDRVAHACSSGAISAGDLLPTQAAGQAHGNDILLSDGISSRAVAPSRAVETSIAPVPAAAPTVADLDVVAFKVGQSLASVERVMIAKTVEKLKGNRTQAAAMLGISVRTLYTKLCEQQQNGKTVESEV